MVNTNNQQVPSSAAAPVQIAYDSDKAAPEPTPTNRFAAVDAQPLS